MTAAPIHALVLDGKGGARDATAQELETGRSSDGVIWVHLDYAIEASTRWLAEVVQLHEVIAEALVLQDPRPRSVVSGDGLLLVLRGINVNEGADPEDMVSLRLWIEPGRVITVRHRRLAAVQEVAERLSRRLGPVDEGDLLYEIIERLLDRIGLIVQGVEDNVDDLEEMVLTAEGRKVRSDLSDLRRRAIALRRYIAPQRETLAHLHAERVPWLSDLARARLRESADRLTRYQEALDSARERAAVTYEELSNRLAEEMNRTMYVLSIVAAIFLPLGLLTGLLGINVGGMPGTDSPLAFTIVTLGLVGVGLLEWLWFRRRSML